MKAGFETNCGCGRAELGLILEQIAGVEGLNEGWFWNKLRVRVSGIRVGFETNCG